MTPRIMTASELLGSAILILWVAACAALAWTVASDANSLLFQRPSGSFEQALAAGALALGVFWASLFATTIVAAYPARYFVRPGIYDRRSSMLIWFGLYHGSFAVLDFFLLRLIRGTVLMRLLYRALGARIGRGAIINTNQISDCHLVSIGDDTIIGADAVINPHGAERDQLHVAPIIIGKRVSIGQYAVILSGTVIEDDVVIGALSLVPKNSRLCRGVAYGGVPARKLRTNPGD